MVSRLEVTGKEYKGRLGELRESEYVGDGRRRRGGRERRRGSGGKEGGVWGEGTLGVRKNGIRVREEKGGKGEFRNCGTGGERRGLSDWRGGGKGAREGGMDH